MPQPRVLVPLDGSSLAEAILPVVQGLDPAEVIRFHAAAGTSPADEVLKAARESKADLIALTTHGESGFDGVNLGRVAAKVIRASPVPVLIVAAERPVAPGGRAPLFDRPLLPVDGSEPSMRAIEMLGRLAPRGTRAHLLSVVESMDDVPPTPAPGPVANKTLDYLRWRAECLEKDLVKDAEKARALGLEPDTRVEIGRPARRILAVAESLPATLIVMGTHGRSGISRWALGSVTEQVLHATPVPLLICR